MVTGSGKVLGALRITVGGRGFAMFGLGELLAPEACLDWLRLLLCELLEPEGSLLEATKGFEGTFGFGLITGGTKTFVGFVGVFGFSDREGFGPVTRIFELEVEFKSGLLEVRKLPAFL